MHLLCYKVYDDLFLRLEPSYMGLVWETYRWDHMRVQLYNAGKKRCGNTPGGFD